jgi:CheY-like chemotaxis protein
MTTEQNQPQAQPPQGQPQGHRRRRRRRKGPKGQANSPQPNGHANQQQPGQNPKQAGSKRFFQKNGTSNGQGGGRRRNKQRKQQVFVGPMDHSYRTANGNVADMSQATIEYRNGNVHPNGFHPVEAAPEPSPVVVRENAPTRIFCFIEDLFFLAKIQETARKLGVKVGFVKAEKDIVAKLADVPEDERPSLIVFDLNNANAKPLTLIPKIKAKLKRGTSVIGFLSHLQGDLKVKALEAGCDMVMPRSAFSQNLPNLLRRHGLEEELETLEA